MTDSAFRNLTQDETIFKDVVWIPAIKAGEAALEYYVPAFALPVLRQIEEGTVELIANALFTQLVLFIDVTAIKFVNDEHKAAFDDAAVKLKLLSKEKGPNSPEYLEELKRAQQDFADFVRNNATK